jgi:hypothetical protein
MSGFLMLARNFSISSYLLAHPHLDDLLRPPGFSACSICSRHGSHKLAGPPRPDAPVCGVVGFDIPARWAA